ncbi:serine/threonine-protein kinase MRCK alpha (CDC42-binding protein kinase alpha) [Desulfarculus baarsii DSM 2075]|uniref:Serine/threonine-protein kinase MRCK alpha (CDC42-binding protein kinase alpha) n=1 Tax=Desulfarculus baarsii (strain ATCC 33931 / DSM 2075 / LMG 7858 / VKM B-1802 / 2st14) TaxID=644282 RepID=E1QGZ5_DESB2|nr:hypothetical protein [Desulfarculus baarsii]ADK84838.1 serine/threonine-protein kinase MRCK alpha (CDC42-binding protein kinase alpha) [Desulfarculus baarsii DSM 2075]
MPKYLAPLALLACLLAAGCATTEDPRTGGLFGYNPEAYQRRAQSQEAQLQALQQEQMQGQQTRGYLEQQRAQKLQEKQRMEQDLAALEGDVAKLQRKIDRATLDTKAQRDRYARIKRELNSVNAEIARLKKAASPANEARIQEIKRLQKKLDGLLQEAEALSRM